MACFTPLGINSTTGVAGLTLGGGFGWLTRRYGMTIDNLIRRPRRHRRRPAAEVSASVEPDLFWALRGGGNFGVVTSFRFRLHPVVQVHGLVVIPSRRPAPCCARGATSAPARPTS